ncbi:MAG: DJ-1/PfpI family protein [Candidatus Kariarchaeaceae archaeon]
MIKNIGIFLFEGAVVLDYAGPYEVFYNAKRFLGEEEIKIFTIGEVQKKIDTKGMIVYPNFAIDNCPKIDILIVPGGTISNVTENTEIMNWFQKIYLGLDKLVTICNGIMILPHLGSIEELEVTTHNYYLDDFQYSNPKSIVKKNKRFTDNGKILTSAGISAGIDLCLYIVDQIWGLKIAAKAAKMMEYDWKRTDSNFDTHFLDTLIENG